MARFLLHDFPAWWRKGCRWLLALCWISGFTVGSCLFLNADVSFSSLMYAASDSRVSIVSLLVVTCLPFLCSAFVVYLRLPWLILPVAFCKAFCIASVSLGIGAAYGGAGWLLRWLLMFSDFVSLPPLYFYWVRHISGQRRFSASSGMLFLAAAMVIGYIDLHFISPILATF